MTFSHCIARTVMFCQYNSKPLPLNTSTPDALLLCVGFGVSSSGQGIGITCLLAEPSKVQAAIVIEMKFDSNKRPTRCHISSVMSQLILYKLAH